MAEQHTRCRFWPRCQVHAGYARDRDRRIFGDAEVADMREDRARGLTYTEIGRVWGISEKHAWWLVNRSRRGL
jgi:hypothetical protein